MEGTGDHTKESNPHADGHDAGYERRDVQISSVVRFGAGLFVGIIVALLLMWGLYRYFESGVAEAERAEVPATRLATDQQQPPAPVLQSAPGSKFELSDPVEEMKQMREEEDELLTNPGWVDQNAGVVRIPINRAKELLLERGLPVRSPTATPDSEAAAPESAAGQPAEVKQ